MAEPHDKPKRLTQFLGLARASARGVTPNAGKMAVRRCRTCDAARPAGSDLSVCTYCGSTFEAVAPTEPEGEPSE